MPTGYGVQQNVSDGGHRREAAWAHGLERPARPHWPAVLRSYVSTAAIGNLVWEAAHLPLYTIWSKGSIGENAFAVVHCTFGDVLLALGTLAIVMVVAGSRDWPARNFWLVAIFTVLLGVGATVFLEWLNVAVRKSWAYSSLMPVLPPVFGFGVGLSPVLQWVVVPALALTAARWAGSERRI